MLAVVFALVAPLVLLFRPDVGPTLGAIAALWIFIARLILEPIRRAFQLKGATAQELFDCDVLGLEWNRALARQISEEEILKAAPSIEDADRSWYPADHFAGWPASVLVCQRANAVWARRQHSAYGWLLAAAASAWFVVGVVVALADGATLSEYLTTVALPSLPAVLDGSELSRAHRETSDRRLELEERADELLATGADHQDLREVQDELFKLRRAAPLVPQWFYKLVRPGYEEGMRYAASRVAATSPASDEEAKSDGSHGE